ncbi:MAG: AIR synthase related protein [Rhodospirillales bacterium]|nr:AIR synthase related protein [Rhodospirillales bacterium]
MTNSTLQLGKLPATLLRELLDGCAPAPGEDAAAVRVEGGTLVVATDPITLTGRDVAAHAVVVNANDVAVTGVRPRWFLCAVMLPAGTTADDVRALFAAMHEALERTGATLLGGHTEVTKAVTQPVVVGQMLGLRADGAFIRTGGAAPGDVIVQIGPAPIEGAAVLANECAHLSNTLAPEVLDEARRALSDPGISVVEPALAAAELGASALHDPTEGGLSAGLYELAEASGVSLEIAADAVLWYAPGVDLCRAVDVDPWGVLASGTLLAAFPERVAAAAVEILEASYPTAVIARAHHGSGVRIDGGRALVRYGQDEVARLLGP